MPKFVDIGLEVLVIFEVLGIIGILVYRSLPSWREDRRNFVEDLHALFALSFIAGMAVAFLSFFVMIVAVTHQQAEISFYVFLGSLIYTVVVGVVYT